MMITIEIDAPDQAEDKIKEIIKRELDYIGKVVAVVRTSEKTVGGKKAWKEYILSNLKH